MMQPAEVYPGRLVYYASSPGRLFAAIVAAPPCQLGSSAGSTWVVRLEGLGEDYRKHACQTRSHVPAAALFALYPREPVPIQALRLDCPACGHSHVDVGEWAERPHRTHLCAVCGVRWRPATYPTSGALVRHEADGHLFAACFTFCGRCGNQLGRRARGAAHALPGAPVRYERHRVAEALDAVSAQVEALRGELLDGADVTATEIRSLASRFANLNDDNQAKVLVEVARIMAAWPSPPSYGMGWQAHAIGRHLRTCECSTEEAREFVRAMASGMEP